MTNKILLVDDEKDIVGLVEEVLQREGFQSIQKAFTGKEAVNLCQQFQPDVVVLDIMLPDMDGLEVCRKIREFSYCSILFLSSRSDDVDKILGLSCGGDDYITKPFSPREVVFRIKAQLRRQQYQAVQPVNEQSCLAAGPLTLDKESCRLYKDGKEIGLTGREFLLLSYLMENADKIISKEELLEKLWNDKYYLDENVLLVNMTRLKKKMKEIGIIHLLENIRGKGWKL